MQDVHKSTSLFVMGVLAQALAVTGAGKVVKRSK
jgi:hypothetical protein